MAFTFVELKKQMEEDLQSGAFRTMTSYTVSDSGGSRTISYKSFDDWEKQYSFVCAKAAVEMGKRPYVGRGKMGTR